MKKLTALLLAVLMMAALLPSLVQAEPVKLTMGSWRSDDAEQAKGWLAKYKELTGVEIVFEPTQSAQYNATLRLQLDNGTGPDLMYARSYAVGEELYEAGFFMDVSDVPGVKENFPASALDGWQAKDGKIFAVPVSAVSHVVYYNVDIFEKHGLKVPETFEDFLALCQELKDKGEQPLANGIADNWDILECVYLGMLPNYVGGVDERVKYESGEKKMNDETFVKSLEDYAKLAKFLPEGFESMGNSDMPAMLALGRAAMFIDGSWTAGALLGEDYKDLNWGAFAIPAPEGNKAGMSFHTDWGMAGNTATKHPEEVKAFLAWVASPEGAEIISKAQPAGFFPMINAEIKLEEQHANDILALNEGKILDSRFVWAKLLDMYTPMVEQLNAIAKGETTPEAAAEVFAAEQAKILDK
ncbi:MAG: ABC transporter substrate-binding protein [Christensenellales bacterium]|jgi:raffinose/stachyose/melibiose transport system substrate-binding protein|nr:carbohydrate ABC transporter substrate-binding protein [Clostridiales bacterium]